jgi:hypothetical protein
MTTSTLNISIGSRKTDQPTSQDQAELDQLVSWFARCRNTLHYMADILLDNSEMAERAVQNCRHKASRNPRVCESEGEFRGWIFRVLIDEALRISPARF